MFRQVINVNVKLKILFSIIKQLWIYQAIIKINHFFIENCNETHDRVKMSYFTIVFTLFTLHSS